MKKIFTLLFAIVCLNSAQAGLYLEPYLGYAFGSADKVKHINPPFYDSKKSYTAPYLGARVGYGMMGLSIGLDYSFTLIDLEIDSQESSNKAAGLFANLDIPVLPLRVWATYFLDWESEVNKSTIPAEVGDTYTGKGLGLGVGFIGLPFIAINLELRKIKIDESKDVSTGVITSYPSSTLHEPEFQEVLLSVSAPFDF